MRCTQEGKGIYVDDWKINTINLLGGHGKKEDNSLSNLKRDGVNLNVA